MNICNTQGIFSYYNSLSFGKQLELLVALSEHLQMPMIPGQPMAGACNKDAITHYLTLLDKDARLTLLKRMINSLKDVPNINNNNLNEINNNNIEREFNMLAGKRRKQRKSRKTSRRRLTRRRR